MENSRAKNVPARIVSWLALMPLLLLAVGCHRDQAQVYQVSTEPDQTPQQNTQAQAMTQTSIAPATNSSSPSLPPMDNSSAQMPAGMAPSDVQNAPAINWTAPRGWTEVPPSEMRVGSFKITGADGKQADMSVVPLAGMAGGDTANVNRWRGQVKLPLLPDDQLANAAQSVQAGGQPAELFDLAGQNSSGQATRILGAIQHRDGTAWFFKMTGDADLVEQQKPAFLAFLQSLSFAPQPAQAPSPLSQADTGTMEGQPTLPPGHPDISEITTPGSGPVSTQGPPGWQVPGDWQPVSAGQFLVAKFAINWIDGAKAAVNVSSSEGDGGGLAANVNRWRGQLGLPPVDEIPAINFTVANGQAQLVDLSGTNAQSGQPTEIVGVMVTQPGQTWFYKLMGDPGVVAAQKDDFTKFVKGVKY